MIVSKCLRDEIRQYQFAVFSYGSVDFKKMAKTRIDNRQKKEINGRIRRVLFLKYKTCPFEDRGNRFRMSHGHLNLYHVCIWKSRRNYCQ